jgi:hypothetical protein
LLNHYLEYTFKKKEAHEHCTQNKLDKWLPFDALQAELFRPTCNYVHQTHDTACRLAEVAAATFLIEFRDPKKAASDYLLNISGIRSWAMVTESKKVASIGKDATSSISESVHALATVGLGIAGIIRLDHVTAEGQTHFNNNFGPGHKELVKRSNTSNNMKERVFGSFHKLPEELKRALILFGKENASSSRKSFDDELAAQREARRQKEVIALQKKLDKMQGDYINAIYFYEQYHSPRCWQAIEDADNNYKKLGSKGKRLKGIKEQLLMRSLVLGWNEAYHAWSTDRQPYTSTQLFRFFKQEVIPLSGKLNVPGEPLLTFP